MEFNDIYDENRHLTGRLHRRGDRWRKGEYGLVVCVWIYDGRGNLLLTRRAPEKTFRFFREEHPEAKIVPITRQSLSELEKMVAQWYENRTDDLDYHLEQYAIHRAFCHLEDLDIDGVMLTDNGRILAFSMGSPLSENTFDIHFEKALEDVDGAYPAINQAFAAYLREKYPQLQYLNREDDMGIPGLRKAKLSYNPHHLVVKFWARLWEDDDED